MLAELVRKGGDESSPRQELLVVVEEAARRSGIRGAITRLKPQAGMGRAKHLLVHLKQVPYPKFVEFMSFLAERRFAMERVRLSAGARKAHVDAELLILGE